MQNLCAVQLLLSWGHCTFRRKRGDDFLEARIRSSTRNIIGPYRLPEEKRDQTLLTNVRPVNTHIKRQVVAVLADYPAISLKS